MTYLWNLLISLINIVRRKVVDIREPEHTYLLKERVRSQRRAAYRLQQYLRDFEKIRLKIYSGQSSFRFSTQNNNRGRT